MACSRNGIQVTPCEDCGRTGVGSNGRLCMGCTSRRVRQDPEKAERSRAASRAWKERNRERNRERDRAYGAAKRAGEVPGLRAVPDELVYCQECGEQMIEWDPDGICGFCILEREEAA